MFVITCVSLIRPVCATATRLLWSVMPQEHWVYVWLCVCKCVCLKYINYEKLYLNIKSPFEQKTTRKQQKWIVSVAVSVNVSALTLCVHVCVCVCVCVCVHPHVCFCRTGGGGLWMQHTHFSRVEMWSIMWVIWSVGWIWWSGLLKEVSLCVFSLLEGWSSSESSEVILHLWGETGRNICRWWGFIGVTSFQGWSV